MAGQVEFHTGVAEVAGYACRLLRKAYHRGARVTVIGPREILARVDRELWTAVERDFVPHLRWSDSGPSAAVAKRTPIWLVDGEPPPGAPEVLVNLGSELVPGSNAFTRIIEVVASDPDSEAAGRGRWRAYKARGLGIAHHAARGGSDG